jgi:CRISPR/Cas system-associated exonuclease Cas4 (RecB family)
MAKIRNRDWNYGGSKWKLSRSKIDLFQSCQKCFYLDNKLGVTRLKLPSFNLNNAVDTLFKKEFDIYRFKNQTHPLMDKYKIDAVPFKHKDLDDWRENFVGIQFVHEPTNMTICGAIDDVWVNKRGELHVVDYKATSTDQIINLDDEWKQGYKRQIEVYQWLLRQKNFEVNERGFIVYANGKTDKSVFEENLEFDVTILEHEGNPDWVEPTIFAIKEILEQDLIPNANENCEYCGYCNLRLEI